MKKRFNLLIYSLLTICFVGLGCTSCGFGGEPESGDSNSSITSQNDVFISSAEISSSEISSVESLSSESESLKFVDFKKAMDNSEPTRIQTIVHYSIPDLQLVLTYTSLLRIEYGPIVEAEYSYSYQQLNPIGSDSMISTYNGIIYSQGNMFGKLDGDSIKWNVNVESSLSLLNINFIESVFENFSINKEAFSGKINDDKIFAFFNNELEISDVTFSCSIDSDLSIINTSDVDYIDSEGANVRISSNYYYESETVIIPAN